MRPENVYRYFRECYQLDYKEINVDNLFATKHKFKWSVSRRERLLSENLPIVPYFNKKIEQLEKEMELYKFEKSLFYAAFYVLGTAQHGWLKERRVCAPLLLFPAQIETRDGDRFLDIDRQDFIINHAALRYLDPISESDSRDRFIKELSDEMAKENPHFLGLKRLVDESFSNVDTDEMLLFPRVWSETKVRGFYKGGNFAEDVFKVVPAAGTVWVEKAESSLRVLHDLQNLADQREFNSSLNDLLLPSPAEISPKDSIYQARLNAAQYEALQNSARFKNSVIVGPPGTGKSYTITSIVADAVVNGESVLVVSKSKQAVEVLRGMLEEDFRLKDYLVHTSGKRYMYSLKSRLKKLLSGIWPAAPARFDQSRLTKTYARLKKQENAFDDLVKQELRIAESEFTSEPDLLDRFRKLMLKFNVWEVPVMWSIFHEIGTSLEALEKEIGTISKRRIQWNLHRNLAKHEYRKEVVKFYDALTSESFTSHKQIVKTVKLEHILKILPIWMANLGDLNSVLPLQKDLFDLVIIDEATQCDIASALPAIFRAKRVVIAGDPNQLKHYSFVSTAQQNLLREKYDLPKEKIFDYRNRSILDFYIAKVQRQEQVTFLREHFRSTPSLIEFSNQQFYDGQLQVMKSTPKHTSQGQVEMIDVAGVRNEKGVNEAEAEAVLTKLVELFERFKEERNVPSIGIISPFNSQASFINKMLRERFELDVIKRFKLVCGTPFQFQGSEREIILLSFGVCNNSHHSAFMHANKPEVLNVAITRAKSCQYVFRSVTDDKLKKDSLLFEYFRFIKTFRHAETRDSEVDAFQQEVVQVIERIPQVTVHFGYPVAGFLLDILVEFKDQSRFVDLIGYPGEYLEAFTHERYKTLARTGIRSYPLNYSHWKKHRKEAEKQLKKFIVRP